MATKQAGDIISSNDRGVLQAVLTFIGVVGPWTDG